MLRYDGARWSAIESGTRASLTGVVVLDRYHAWTVGQGGTAMFFDGSGWTRQETGVGWNLRSVTAVDARHVYAAGDRGVLFFDGDAWSLQWDSRQGGLSSALTGISALDNDHVWAVGNPVMQLNVGAASVFFYNGSAWTEELKVPDSSLSSVHAEAGRVWAATDTGTVLVRRGSWKKSLVAPDLTDFRGICAEGGGAWAVGNSWHYTPVIYRFDGTWARQGG